MKMWRSSISLKMLLIHSAVLLVPLLLFFTLTAIMPLTVGHASATASRSIAIAQAAPESNPNRLYSAAVDSNELPSDRPRIRHATATGEAISDFWPEPEIRQDTMLHTTQDWTDQGWTDQGWESQELGLSLRTTVGMDKHQCAEEQVLGISSGTLVVYCYFVTNTGTEPINFHAIEDSHQGTILSQAAFPLAAGASALVTTTVQITQTTVSTGTWSGLDASGETLVSALAPAKVYVDPLITNPGVIDINGNCVQQSEIGATSGETLDFCYTLTNNTDLPLITHVLTDSQSGLIAANLNFSLQPGQTVTTRDLGLSLAHMVSSTVNYTLTWIAESPLLPAELAPFYSTHSTANAVVQTEPSPFSPLSEHDSVEGKSESDGTATIPTLKLSGTPPVLFSTQGSIGVLVPSLTGKLTVGLEAGVCAETTALTVFEGADVVFCYFAENSGGLTLTHHTVSDTFPLLQQSPNSPLGQRLIVENTFYEMAPGSSGQFTNSQAAITSTNTVMVWTGFSGNRELNTSNVISVVTSSEVSITVLPLANIQIQLFEDANQNQIREDGEAGIGRAEVQLIAESSSSESADSGPNTGPNAGAPFIATTNSAGIATFQGIPPEIYQVVVLFPDPLQNFEPIGSEVMQLLLRGGSNDQFVLGFKRIGEPPKTIYLPYR